MLREFIRFWDWPSVGLGLLILAGYLAAWAAAMLFALFLGVVAGGLFVP